MLLRVMAGLDPRDPASLKDKPEDYLSALEVDVSGLRIGWSADFGFTAVDPEVVEIASSAAKAFEDLGCHVEESDLALDSPQEPFRVIFSTNIYAGLGFLLKEQPDQLTDYVLDGLENGRHHTGADYNKALGYRDKLIAQFADQFEKYDLLLSPTMSVPAFRAGDNPTMIAGVEVDAFLGFLSFTFPINMIDHAVASMRCGFSSDGMPIGLHIVGRAGGEETIIAASAAFERARAWISQRPSAS